MFERIAVVLAGFSLVVSAGCGSKKDDVEGMPPAADWKTPTAGGGPEVSAPAGTANPHGGATPVAPGSANPHAGMDIGAAAGGAPASPHGALGGGATATLKGTITASAETKALVKPGMVIFLSVKPVDAKTGAPTGGPLAVDKMEKAVVPAPFELGIAYQGDVLVTIHASQGHDASKKIPGDLVGTAITKLPADNVVVELDTIIP